MEAKILEGLRKILSGQIRHKVESLEKLWISQEPYQLVTGRLVIRKNTTVRVLQVSLRR